MMSTKILAVLATIGLVIAKDAASETMKRSTTASSSSFLRRLLEKGKQKKVNVCHFTGADKPPFTIEVNENAVPKLVEKGDIPLACEDIGCFSSADCTTDNFCDGAVVCNSDYQCEALLNQCQDAVLRFCNEDIDGCVECLSDGDCPLETIACKQRLCGQGGVCDRVDDCNGDDICNEANGQCLECLVSDDCPGDGMCDEAEGQCVECLGDDECLATSACRKSQCEAEGVCKEVDNCPGGDVCDPSKGECVGCLRDTDCPGADVCDEAKGECVVCVSGPDCPFPFNRCIVDVISTLNKCVICTSGDDCGSQILFKCSVDGNCVECLNDNDCFRDPEFPYCVEEACAQCRTDSDCDGIEECIVRTVEVCDPLDDEECLFTDTSVCEIIVR